MTRIVVAALVFFFSPLAFAGFDTSGFVPRSLTSWESSIVASKLYPRTESGHAFDAESAALSSTVEYTGTSRRLGSEKSEFLRRFSQDVLHDQSVSALYETEIEVRENGFKYWIAVQKNIFPHLQKELETGESFTIYYRFAGVAPRRQPVYLMMEFDSGVARNGRSKSNRI